MRALDGSERSGSHLGHFTQKLESQKKNIYILSLEQRNFKHILIILSERLKGRLFSAAGKSNYAASLFRPNK
jgi:hypothetical protein